MPLSYRLAVGQSLPEASLSEGQGCLGLLAELGNHRGRGLHKSDAIMQAWIMKGLGARRVGRFIGH